MHGGSYAIEACLVCLVCVVCLIGATGRGGEPPKARISPLVCSLLLCRALAPHSPLSSADGNRRPLNPATIAGRIIPRWPQVDLGDDIACATTHVRIAVGDGSIGSKGGAVATLAVLS